MRNLPSPHSEREEKVYNKMQTSREHQFILKFERKHFENGPYQTNRS